MRFGDSRDLSRRYWFAYTHTLNLAHTLTLNRGPWFSLSLPPMVSAGDGEEIKIGIKIMIKIKIKDSDSHGRHSGESRNPGAGWMPDRVRHDGLHG